MAGKALIFGFSRLGDGVIEILPWRRARNYVPASINVPAFLIRANDWRIPIGPFRGSINIQSAAIVICPERGAGDDWVSLRGLPDFSCRVHAGDLPVLQDLVRQSVEYFWSHPSVPDGRA